MSSSSTAEVRLGDRPVGRLTYDHGGSTFWYEDDLTRWHPILGQTFEDEPRKLRRARVGLPSWFANLLPEGALRRQIVRDMGGGNIGDYTLLLRLGADLPGAVTVHSSNEPGDDVSDDTHDIDHPLRHSLAGVQLKYAIPGERLTFPASGNHAWWIAKVPDRSLHELAVNEFVTMRWLQAASFPVPTVQLVPAAAVGGLPEGLVDATDQVYLIERFDRSPAGRVHVEDFAQVADVPPQLKYGESGATYDSLAATIHQVAGPDNYAEYIRRLTAMLVIGNTDAHLKNWAFIYPGGRTPKLSPVYDFHSLTVYSAYRFTPLALSINGEKLASSVEPDDFRRLAEHVGVDPETTVGLVSATVDQLRSSWTDQIRAEAEARFPALAKHYAHRLDTLRICTSV